MRWVIDIDVLALGEEDPGPPGTNKNAVGMCGPRTFKGDPSELHYVFTIHDADGTLYYVGRCDVYGHMGPLDNFGTPNAGATEIRYWNNATDAWETV